MIDITDDPRMLEVKERLGFNLQESLKDKLTPEWGVDTGKLKAGIKFYLDGDDIVIEMDKTGAYIEFGTPPHIISAKNAKSLAFKVNGKTVFAKSVKHPGTRPFPFIRNTFKQEFTDLLVEALNKSFR